MSLGNTFNHNIPTSGVAARWIRAQVGNRKDVDSVSVPEQGNAPLRLNEKTYRQFSHNEAKLSLTKDCITHQALCWFGRQTQSV